MSDYDSGDTVGLGGSYGDDAVHEDNEADYQYTDEVDADETTGLTNDGTVVVEENDPADVEDDSDFLPGSSYEGDPDGWYDASHTEDGNSPGGTGTGSMEPNTQGDVTTALGDGAAVAWETSADALDDAADVLDDTVDDAREAALPDWANWLLDHPTVTLGVAALLGVSFLGRPYAGLLDSAT